MENIFIIIINGIVEGLTEFIPVSSTGHLIVLEHFLSFPSNDPHTFQISIQCGAILAVLFFYRSFFTTFLSSLKQQRQLLINFILVMLPTFIIGFLCYDYIKANLFSTTTVVSALIVGGIAMILTDKFAPKVLTDNTLSVTQALTNISTKQALTVGLFQVLSLWPGMSRSGSTIVGGVLAGLSYKTAADFSFCCALPVIFAAVFYDLIKTSSALTATDYGYIGIGFLISFFVGLVAIKFIINWIPKIHLTPFGIYRILFGIGVFILL